MLGMVHPHNPLGPRQVLDWLPPMSPFPVQDGRDRAGGRVEQNVVRPVVTVHQDARDLILLLDASQRRINRVDAPQHLAARAQDLISLTSID